MGKGACTASPLGAPGVTRLREGPFESRMLTLGGALAMYVGLSLGVLATSYEEANTSSSAASSVDRLPPFLREPSCFFLLLESVSFI